MRKHFVCSTVPLSAWVRGLRFAPVGAEPRVYVPLRSVLGKRPPDV